jgi:hypothetical protein
VRRAAGHADGLYCRGLVAYGVLLVGMPVELAAPVTDAAGASAYLRGVARLLGLFNVLVGATGLCRADASLASPHVLCVSG